MPEDMSVRDKVGSVFVKLTAQLYGGEITRNGNNDPVLGNPDIINWDRNQAYESKASISSDHHKLRPRQIDHYRELQQSEFPLDHPEVYYFLWQHKKRGISRFQDRELEKTIIEHTNRLLIVSFDVIEAGTTVWGTTGETCSWGKMYMLRSSERTALTKTSNEELTRMGLNPKDYTVTRETIPPKTYKYKWWNLPEFTITRICNSKWRDVERT